nr:hypothetical protein [Photobacterium aquae]
MLVPLNDSLAFIASILSIDGGNTNECSGLFVTNKPINKQDTHSFVIGTAAGFHSDNGWRQVSKNVSTFARDIVLWIRGLPLASSPWILKCGLKKSRLKVDIADGEE